MGFYAKAVILFKENASAAIPSIDEESYAVWKDSGLGIDFDRVTRVEKVTEPRFAHITFRPFELAGICTIDCFLANLWIDFDDMIKERFAPEIIVHKPLLYQENDLPEPTITIGGRSYLDCSLERLKGRIGNDQRIERIGLGRATRYKNYEGQLRSQ
jgi:hypothetical protein